MIFDRLNNLNEYKFLGEKFRLGFDFLLKNNLEEMKDGKYSILNDDIFANVQTLYTKSKDEKKWEAHRNYIDIQYLIKGKETQGFGILEDYSEIIPYDKTKDIAFLNLKDEKDGKFNYINLNSGDFTIFYPRDVHAPMLSFDENEHSLIKKVIVKIRK